MNFLSIEWFLVMALTVGVYWILPYTFRTAWLVTATAAFLIAFDIRSFFLLALFAAILIYVTRSRRPTAYEFLGAGIVILGSVFVYKLQYRGQLTDPVGGLGIPLGLSYFAFRSLHLIIETYRKTLGPQKPMAVLGYLFFLPTIVVGPINRAGPYFEDRKNTGLSYSKFSQGLERILYGYVKIAFIGNLLLGTRLGGIIHALGPADQWLKLYLFMAQSTFSLYVQFSGFSDVAIGFGLLLGYRIMENFNWPILQTNIAAFWRSWHISLTSWSRDYVYMPLIGVYRNPYLATITSFAFIGLWHDISWQYLVWGLYHAAGIMGWQQWQRIKRRIGVPSPAAAQPIFKLLSILLTVHFFMLGTLIVTEPNLAAAGRAVAEILWGWI